MKCSCATQKPLEFLQFERLSDLTEVILRYHSAMKETKCLSVQIVLKQGMAIKLIMQP